MKSLKIILLSSVFLFTNCSLINDKFFSKSKRNNDNQSEEREVQTSSEESKEEDLVMEKIYIDDKNDEKSENIEGLQGDSKYPNLAEVPNRPDPIISMEEQKSIIQDLENNSQLESLPSEPFIERKVSTLEPNFNKIQNDKIKKEYNNIKSHKDTSNSIRNIQISKLDEIKNFRPNDSNSNNKATMSDEEKELHSLAKELKNIKTQEQIINVEDKIKKNDIYYNPNEIEKILGLKGLDSKEKKNEVIVKKTDISKEQNITKTKIIEKRIEEREVPVARVTFNHGSSQLSDEDLLKIKKVANLFYKNEGKKIVIVGHSSSRTNYDMDLTKHALVNFNISLERARKVMKEFSTIGLNSQTIELIAKSDANPLYDEIMPRLEAANRRAEIFIQY